MTRPSTPATRTRLPVSDPLILDFSDAPDQERYEARLDDGGLAAVIDYRLDSRWIALLHTDVKPEFGGRGVASRFATWAFEDARARGLKVVPSCPYIRAWIPRHSEFHDLLARASDAVPLAAAEDPA